MASAASVHKVGSTVPSLPPIEQPPLERSGAAEPCPERATVAGAARSCDLIESVPVPAVPEPGLNETVTAQSVPAARVKGVCGHVALCIVKGPETSISLTCSVPAPELDRRTVWVCDDVPACTVPKSSAVDDRLSDRLAAPRPVPVRATNPGALPVEAICTDAVCVPATLGTNVTLNVQVCPW